MRFLRGLSIAMLAAVALAGCGDRPAPVSPGAVLSRATTLQSSVVTRVLRVPEAFSTIQAAVDAAEPGDIIQVAPGVYVETVLITTAGIRLQGQRGAVLDGESLRDEEASALFGIHVQGTTESPVTGVEIAGLEVRNFERGIVLERVQGSRVLGNDVHDNTDMNESDGFNFLDGIVLVSSSFNEVVSNETHDNGHDGIQLSSGSTGNLVRANRTHDNGGQTPFQTGCGINLAGSGNNHNRIVENEVIGNHWGILITGPSPGSTGNFIAQNRAHGQLRAGVAVAANSSGNVIARNDARGNGSGGLAPSGPFDLFDAEPVDNTWERNKGTSNF